MDADKIKRTIDLNALLGADFVKELKAQEVITQAEVHRAKEILTHQSCWQVAGDSSFDCGFNLDCFFLYQRSDF